MLGSSITARAFHRLGTPPSRIAWIFATVAVISIASTCLVYVMGLRVAVANQAVMRNREIMAGLVDLFTALKDAETDERDFLLTGDDKYLDPYIAATKQINAPLQLLAGWARSGDVDSVMADDVTHLTREELKDLSQVIEQRRQQGLEAAKALAQENAGKRNMDALRRQTTSMSDQEKAKLAASLVQREASTWRRTFAAIGSSMVTLAFLVWAFRRIQNGIADVERQKQLLAVTLASIGDGVIVTDARGRVAFLNGEAERLTGWTTQQASGQVLPAVFRIINEETRQSVESPVDLVLRTNAVGGLTNHTILIAQDGHETAIDDSAAPIRNSEGDMQGVVLVFRDFSERRRAEEAVQRARTTAETANKAKDNFLAVLSHELRNPLNPVLAAGTLLLRDKRFDTGTREQLEMICRNAELEARLIDDLLDMTRIERGKVELDRRPVDLQTIIRRAAEVCAPEVAAKSLDLRLDLEPMPCWVDADAARLQQVFWNLIRNAVKFTPAGGHVDVHCRRNQDGSVVARIIDNGKGIEPADLDRIFNPFEQVDRSITRQFGGLGLGLTISKAIVDMHGGTISAHSEGKDKGATFTVRLPLLPAEMTGPSAPPATTTTTVVAHATRPLRILLVEDHADTARVMRIFLKANGHEVQNAADVATALSLTEKQNFDLMLSDLGLPDGTGLALMRALRAKGSVLPAIALSGYGQEKDVQESRDAGFVIHLTKPISLLRLEEAIAMTMGNGTGPTADSDHSQP